MHRLKCSLALFASQWALVHTQQSCYWPDGSGVRAGQGYWVNCHSSQDSVCCFHEDVCMANGLCFGSIINMVYRGGCTVKDWSNTTACPNQWCNDVQKDTWSNIWLCPGLNNGPIQWWCGNETETTACRNGIDAHFLNYTKGSILGFPPVTSSSSVGTEIPSDTPVTSPPSVGTEVPSDTVTATFFTEPISNPTSVLASSPSKTSTDPSTPTQTQDHSTALPTAIGVGVGVPLGIASLGLLGFLFWKQVGQQRTSQSRVLSQGPTLGTGDQSARAAIRGQWTELPDIQRPSEMGGTGRKELPGS